MDGANWVYGFKAATNSPWHTIYLVRMAATDTSPTTISNVTTINANYQISTVFATSTPNLIFVVLQDTGSASPYNNYLYRSTDGGATLSLVFTFGNGNGPSGGNTPAVNILTSICEVTTPYPGTSSGVGDLIFGEYNTNTSRTNGSTNDRVRLVRSTDQGATWTPVMTWNTDGSHNNIGHIHTVRQDPYTGYIYICTGDAANKSSIIQWDGVSSWTNNTNVSAISGWTGFHAGSGSERYRTVDVIFDANYLYAFADTYTYSDPSHTEAGIWRGAKDLSSYTRVNNDTVTYDGSKRWSTSSSAPRKPEFWRNQPTPSRSKSRVFLLFRRVVWQAAVR